MLDTSTDTANTLTTSALSARNYDGIPAPNGTSVWGNGARHEILGMIPGMNEIIWQRNRVPGGSLSYTVGGMTIRFQCTP